MRKIRLNGANGLSSVLWLKYAHRVVYPGRNVFKLGEGSTVGTLVLPTSEDGRSRSYRASNSFGPVKRSVIDAYVESPVVQTPLRDETRSARVKS